MGECEHEDLQNGWCEPCDRLIECCFPDCGCDGARNCDAESGAHSGSLALNIGRGGFREIWREEGWDLPDPTKKALPREK